MSFLIDLSHLLNANANTNQIENVISHQFNAMGRIFLCCLLNKIKQSNVSCPSVKNIQLLGEKGKVGVPYLIQMKDLTLVLKITPNASLNFEISKKQTDKIYESKCIASHSKGTIYFASSDFLNESLIAMAIDQSWPPSYPRFYVKHLLAGKCQKNGLNLMILSTKGNLEQFVQNFSQYVIKGQVQVVQFPTILNILKQVCVALDILQKIGDFSSNDMKPANVFVSDEKIDFHYQNVKIKSDFICQVADFGKSTFTFQKKIVFYNKNRWASLLNKVKPFQPNIFQKGQEYFYRFNQKSLILLSYIRHQQGNFYKSLDWYCFIIGLFALPSFFYSLQNPIVNKIWKLLWISFQEEKIAFERLKKLVEKRIKHIRFIDITMVLFNLSLKCNIISETLLVL